MYVLLISAQSAKTLLSYGIYAAIIIVGLCLLIAVKRRTKKQLKPEWVKNRALKAQKYAQSIINLNEKKGWRLLLGSTKLIKLSGYVEDAAWAAYQIVELKKDIVFEGVAAGFDKLSNELSALTQDGFIPADAYERCVKRAIDTLDASVQKIDALMDTRAKK